jgi:hypothetical protein
LARDHITPHRLVVGVGGYTDSGNITLMIFFPPLKKRRLIMR